MSVRDKQIIIVRVFLKNSLITNCRRNIGSALIYGHPVFFKFLKRSDRLGIWQVFRVDQEISGDSPPENLLSLPWIT